ncbi:unnamed protein product [Rotaria sp. Silwood2]|nr:unnamed protein product [Rotaria sp. Silwood2]CAF2621850.1 unnamed protein product [Rotaria sp. Silwood2]CAF4424137.1 unnamed protein product [Rotaria sp. Silwood2]CAF4450421.1 unnamed protein product [Rotaria sp. Silwood2]
MQICEIGFATTPEETVSRLLEDPHVKEIVSILFQQGHNAKEILKEVLEESKVHRDSIIAKIGQENNSTTSKGWQYQHRYTDVIILKVQKSNDIRKKDGPCFFNGHHDVLGEIFKDFTPIITIHHEDELKPEDHDAEKLYSMIEIPSMSFVAPLQTLHSNFFFIVSNSTYNGDKTNIQEFIFLRHNHKHDEAKP